jgi:hypothetical protein
MTVDLISNLNNQEFVIMSSNSSPIVVDDFKCITGIGRVIERRLHEAGILTFAQLAALEPGEIAALVNDLAGMSVERVAQQDWPGQARKLAPTSASAEAYQAASAGDRQHDVSFTVKLLLNEDHRVRRTQVVDNRSKAEEQWAGWDGSRMLEFVSRQAALQQTLPTAVVAETERVAATTVEAATAAEPTPPPMVPTNFGGVLHLRELKAMPIGNQGSRNVVRHGQPFNVQFTLDLMKVVLPSADPLEYTAVVYAKRLGASSRQPVGEARQTIMPREQLNLLLACKPLPPDTYRLEAVVTLAQPPAKPELMAHLEGGILQVY